MPSNYSQSSKVGVDLNNVSDTALFTLGDTARGTNGTEYLYCYFATGATAGKAMVYNQGFTCTGGDATNLLLGFGIGWVQATVSSSSYGWLAVRGSVAVMTSGSATVSPNGIFLPGASGTTGIVSVNYSASGTLAGIAFTSIAQTASATLTGAILTWPRGGALGQ